MSGTAFSQKGPLKQLWDNSNDSFHVLAGFVFDEDLRYLKDESTLRSSPIMQQLKDLFGEDAGEPEKILFKSWMHDPMTYTAQVIAQHGYLPFGHPLVRSSHGGSGRIIFAGTETAANENGHMNGAVIAGFRAADDVWTCLRS